MHSDASYLSELRAHSRAGGHYFINDWSLNPLLSPRTDTTLNGPIFTVSKIITNIMASTADAKICATLINIQGMSLSIPLYAKLATHNLQLPSASTIQQQKGSPTIPSSRSYPRRSTCASTESKFVKAKASSLSTGNQVAPTLVNTTKKNHPPAQDCLMRSTFVYPTTTLTNNVISNILWGCGNSTVTARTDQSYFQSQNGIQYCGQHSYVIWPMPINWITNRSAYLDDSVNKDVCYNIMGLSYLY